MTETGKENRGEEAPLDLPKPIQRNRRWTLLLVGDSGKIIRVKRIRGWITLLAALPVLALVLVAGAYLRSDSWPGRIRRPTDEINRLRAEVRTLTEENARLAGRHSAPEAEVTPGGEAPAEKMPAAPSMLPTGPPQRSSDSSDARVAETGVGPTSPPVKAEDSAPSDESGKIADAPESQGEASGPDGGRSVPVEVEDLRFDFDPDRNTVSVDFRIFNRRPDGETLFGYAFVILKADEQKPEQWLVFPEAALNAEGPVSFKMGYDFSISNYMVIRFNPRPLPSAMVFLMATVQVYDASGRLLLAKDFQLNPRN